MKKTIVVAGAGAGLGSSVARRFGRAGFRVALVARDQDRLDRLATELAAEGIEAAAFSADLSRPERVPALIDEVRRRFGRIDVVEYAPITTEGFTPAAELTPAGMAPHLNLFLLTPIALAQAVLPEFTERGDGAFLLGQGVSATHPMPRLSGLGPAMAAARNYLQSLHGELAPIGVYVGAIHVAAMVLGSAGHAAITSGELAGGIDISRIPQVKPDDIAEALWQMYNSRDEFERQIPQLAG